MLATEIYRRERGALPPSDEALVGTYLKSLPDDGSGELADGTTPTVEEGYRPDRRKNILDNLAAGEAPEEIMCGYHVERQGIEAAIHYGAEWARERIVPFVPGAA